MDSLSIILLTAVPSRGLVTSLGFNPIWFGVLLVSLVEIGLITPPIGIKLFVVKGVAPQKLWGLPCPSRYLVCLGWAYTQDIRQVVVANVHSLRSNRKNQPEMPACLRFD